MSSNAIPYPPRQIVLRARPRTPDSSLCTFEVRDNNSNELLFAEPTQKVHSWLQTFGYKWLTGSLGVWYRAA